MQQHSQLLRDDVKVRTILHLPCQPLAPNAKMCIDPNTMFPIKP